MTHNGVINKFSGEYRWLSNFWIHDEIRGLSVEHHYQAAKADNYDDYKLVMSANSPADAKRIGKTIKIRWDWETVKLSLMEQFIREKFSKNPPLRENLLQTRGIYLIEGNNWGDTFFGVCNGEGQNHLGKILMKVRDEYFRYY